MRIEGSVRPVSRVGVRRISRGLRRRRGDMRGRTFGRSIVVRCWLMSLNTCEGRPERPLVDDLDMAGRCRIERERGELGLQRMLMEGIVNDEPKSLVSIDFVLSLTFIRCSIW